jgi:PAS domain S-box-containing protein
MSAVHSRLSSNMENLNSPFHAAIQVFLVAALAYLSAILGSGMAVPPHNISPLWPTNAVVLVVLLAVRRRIWPTLIATAYLVVGIVNVRHGVPIALSAWLVLGNVVEVLIAALGVSYFFKSMPRLNSPKALAQYSLCGAILAPFAGAFVGALAANEGSYWLHWRMWFLSDGLALFTLPPAIWGLVHWVSSLGRKSRAYFLELAALTVLLFLFGYTTLVASGKTTPQALLYPLVPFLLWSAFRFGSTGTSLSVIMVSVLSVWGAVHGHGPFAEPGPINNVLSLQLFLLFTAAPFMVLAALVEDRQHSEQTVRESEQRLRVAAEVGRMYAWEWDPVTDSVLRSAECADILGLNDSARQGSARDYFTLIHPDDRAGLRSLVNSLTPENPVYRTHYRRFLPGGALLWLEESGCATFDRSAKMVRLVGMTADITERKRTEEALASVSGRLIEAQEQERTRIGRDLHDDIGQRLTMLTIGLQELQQDSSDWPAEVRSRMGDLGRQSSEIAADLQSLSHELHSSKLQYLGMVAAMRAFCKEFSEQQKAEIDFGARDLPSPLPQNVSLCLFRVLQEALHNSVKHSGVRQFEVRLWGRSGEIHLTVRDAGAGFDADAARKGRGIGLISMEERTKLVNGTFSIESQPKRGTTVHVHVPLSSDDHSTHVAG